ncbi:unnamed protein product [Fraxinus pennsylvanica]|uniref:Uncharacterized protein n=1 Tax=Fraxinus pennsylvanica TaxID=56036 RepID=A0AAD2A2A1_9LAMI|nr:unnamed protein product [Fraxinus pennsylvanica]
MYSLAYQDPILLVSIVEKMLIPKLNYLVSLGFSKDDVVEIKPKFEYFDKKKMMGSLDEHKEFPHYFAFSVEMRIKPRRMKVVQCGIVVSLSLTLKSIEDEFRELIRQGGG